MASLLTIGFLLLAAWLWRDGRRAHEAALAICTKLCAREAVQLLDQTVAVKRITLGRDADSRLGLRRSYQFEFTADGITRHRGYLLLHGTRLELVQMDTEPGDG